MERLWLLISNRISKTYSTSDFLKWFLSITNDFCIQQMTFICSTNDLYIQQMTFTCSTNDFYIQQVTFICSTNYFCIYQMAFICSRNDFYIQQVTFIYLTNDFCIKHVFYMFNERFSYSADNFCILIKSFFLFSLLYVQWIIFIFNKWL